ncbi:MAG: hypothetical protein L0Y56_04825, partial [Nitrospira sp.]|nr:hypothetical protein [Nitrospira sp.]
PVTSFISNMGFNLGQYIKTAVAGDKVAKRMLGPALAYLTYQVMMAGLKGLPGYEDMDTFVAWLNTLYVEKFGGEWLGTPSELLNSLGMNDYVMYGVPSASTGINMTGTLGFGHVLPSAITELGDASKMFPGVDFGLKMVEAILMNVANIAGDNMTEEEKVRATSQLAPGATKEWVRQLLSQEGLEGVGEGRGIGADKRLVYERDPVENIKALLTGRPSMREAEEKHKMRLYDKRDAAVDSAKTRAVDLLVDSIQRGKPMPDMVTRVISNYPELSETVVDSAFSELDRRRILYRDRELVKAIQSTNMSGMRKLQTLQELFSTE